jgi:hypothetical protein
MPQRYKKKNEIDRIYRINRIGTKATTTKLGRFRRGF